MASMRLEYVRPPTCYRAGARTSAASHETMWTSPVPLLACPILFSTGAISAGQDVEELFETAETARETDGFL